MSTDHLQPEIAEKLSLPDKERIEYIRKPRWIGYPQAQSILDKLEDLLEYPKQPRMPNMLLVGETNNGKTMLIDRFRQRHPARENDDQSAVIVPVLYVQAPPGPDEIGLYDAILKRLFERSPASESASRKRGRVVDVLKRIELGIIVIDEIHGLLAGSSLKQRNFLNTIKYLGNELGVPIVGVGTADALRALQVDPQLENRFSPEVLPRWKLDAEFGRLLASFESLLPLKYPSSLARKEMASRILAMTGGTIGEISLLLNAAAIYAIRKKTEVIDTDVLGKCDYRPPSERRSVAARM